MDDFYDFIFETPEQSAQHEADGAAWFHAPQALEQPQQAPAETRGRGRHKTALRFVALALVCSLLGGAVGAGAVALAGGGLGTAAGQTDVQVSSRDPVSLNLVSRDSGTELTAAQIYAANVNSTVGITAQLRGTGFLGSQSIGQAAGSGFLISSDGYILTNYHVIEDASAIEVTLYDGSSYAAEAVGWDESNDVAVLKIEAEGLVPVTLGDSDALNVGDAVFAIGNPLGELTFSLTAGIVSALERDVTVSSGSTMSLIQTDCAINAGNSGGALFNSYGEVIGITNAKYSASDSTDSSIDNIGFAIPINRAMRIAESILTQGYYVKPYLGVTVQTAAEDTETGAPAGVAVVAVNQGSPAAQGGLLAGDIITAADGKQLKNSGELVALVADSAPGQTLVLNVWRDGQTLALTITVGTQSQDDAGQSRQS